LISLKLKTINAIDIIKLIWCSFNLQALGVPTGSHGAFRDYQVDAITLELSPRVYLHNENAKSAFLLRSGRLVAFRV